MLIPLEKFFQEGAICAVEPSLLLIGWGRPVRSHQPHLTLPSFYAPDFFLRAPQPWLTYPQTLYIPVSLFLDILDPPESQSAFDLKDDGFSYFKTMMHEVETIFREGKLHKIVPYTRSQGIEEVNGLKLASWLKTSITHWKKNGGYLHGYWSADKGKLGVSPELLFEYDGTFPFLLKSMALASTKPSQQTDIAFATDPHYLAEHTKVIQGIKAEASVLGFLETGSTSILHLPHLTHLYTPLTITLKQPFSFSSAIHCLHPTPALGAYPRQEGLPILKNWDRLLPRKNFGAPFGWNDPQKQRSLVIVSIRFMSWDKKNLEIWAGCGVIPTSNFDTEWGEVQRKIKAIRHLFTPN